MLGGLGPTELIIILAIVLIIFGAGKLPMVGKQLGGAISEFKHTVKGEHKTPEESKEKEEKPE